MYFLNSNFVKWQLFGLKDATINVGIVFKFGVIFMFEMWVVFLPDPV